MKTLLSFLIIPLFLLGGEPIWLTWQQDPCTTMTISWLSQDRDNEIAFHSLNEEWQAKSGTHTPLPYDGKTFVHRVELTKLKPDTAYTFSLKNQEMRFRTLPLSLNDPLRFVVGGDMYTDSTPEAMIETCKQAAKTNPSFVVIGGDIAYSSSSIWFFKEDASRWLTWLDAWFDQMVTSDGFLIPIVPAIGNHEVNGRFGQTPHQAKYFYTLFPMKGVQAYRSLSFGDYLLLILLDSGHTASVNGEQAEWLKRTLEENTLPKTFAVYHVPAYPSSRGFNNQYSKKVRKYWTPIFDTFALDVAFEHHDHAYKRSYKLKGNKRDESGTLYLGDGAWSPGHLRSKKKNPWYIENLISSKHFIVVDLSKNESQFTVLDPEGNTLDKFKL